MVGILMAPPETKLWYRLEKENRLLPGGTGDNTDGSTNIVPKMRFDVLIDGYKQVLAEIYSPKKYYERIRTFLMEYRKNASVKRKSRINADKLRALIGVTFSLGIKDKERSYYWKLVFYTLKKCPKYFSVALTLAAQGFHFRKVYEKVKQIQIPTEAMEYQRKVLGTSCAETVSQPA